MKTQDGIALMNRLKTLLQTSKKAKITAASSYSNDGYYLC